MIKEKDYTDVEIVMPWWGEMGIYFPFYSELKNKMNKKGKRLFRYSFFGRSGDRQGMTLTLENVENEKKMEIFLGECLAGGGAQVGISPGDRGRRGACIGYFLWGGLVRLRFFAVERDLLIRRGERLVAGRTCLWED